MLLLLDTLLVEMLLDELLELETEDTLLVEILLDELLELVELTEDCDDSELDVLLTLEVEDKLETLDPEDELDGLLELLELVLELLEDKELGLLEDDGLELLRLLAELTPSSSEPYHHQIILVTPRPRCIQAG